MQIALLRGINVGGNRKLPMADLRAAFASLGYPDARTLLQTGNVVFRSEAASGAALEAEIEQALADELGLVTDVLVRSGEEWRKAVAANPFSEEISAKPNLVVLMPLKTAPGEAALGALRDAIKGPERASLSGAQLYLFYPDGIGRSKLTGAVIEKKLGTRGTARNWNTVLKIADAARAA